MGPSCCLLLSLLMLPGAIRAQSFSSKTGTESSTVREAVNTLTFTIQPTAAIAPGGTITLAGMTGTGTSTGTLAVSGANAARVGSSGNWNQGAGTLVLTVANGETVPTGSDTVFTVELENAAVSQSVTITIESSSSCVGDSSSNSDEVACTGITGNTYTAAKCVGGGAAADPYTADADGTLCTTDESPGTYTAASCTNGGNAGSQAACEGTATGNTFSSAIGGSTLSTTLLQASTVRPTVTAASPSRVYKSFATSVTFTGAGSIAAGDKIKYASACGSAGTEVTLDGSAAGSTTLGSASATGDKICFKDVGNGFDWVDTGLRMPVAEITQLSGGSSVSVGLGISTDITLIGTGATTADYIKICTSGSSCGTCSQVAGGANTALTNSGARLTLTMTGAATNSKVCYNAGNGGQFADTGLTLTSQVASITSVNVAKVVSGSLNSISYTFTGVGLHSHCSVKIASTCSGSSNAGTTGGTGQSLSSANNARTSATKR